MLRTLFLAVLVGNVDGATIWSWSHETSRKDIHSVLHSAFEYSDTHGQFGIGSDDSLSIEEDPKHAGQYVLRVKYKKGTFSSHNSAGNPCDSAHGEKCQRGAQFYSTPHAMSSGYTTMTLEYEVLFDSSFLWNRGGKLPGLFGGTRDCSGGRISNTCFSTRMMWRPLGDGEVYVYTTHDQQPSFTSWCDKYEPDTVPIYQRLICGSKGLEFGRGAYRFHHNTWHRVKQEVHLNSIGGKGYIKVWIDDHAEIYVTDIVMRDNTGFDIDGIFFSTFYGGDDHTWACPQDTYTYFRNFKLSTGTATASHSELVVG